MVLCPPGAASWNMHTPCAPRQRCEPDAGTRRGNPEAARTLAPLFATMPHTHARWPRPANQPDTSQDEPHDGRDTAARARPPLTPRAQTPCTCARRDVRLSASRVTASHLPLAELDRELWDRVRRDRIWSHVYRSTASLRDPPLTTPLQSSAARARSRYSCDERSPWYCHAPAHAPTHSLDTIRHHIRLQPKALPRGMCDPSSSLRARRRTNACYHTLRAISSR